MRRIDTTGASGRPSENSINELPDADLDPVTGAGIREIVDIINQLHREAVIRALWQAATGTCQSPADTSGQGPHNPLSPT